MQETLSKTKTPGEAMGTAAKLTAMALEAGQREAAELLYVIETELYDPTDNVVLETAYEVVASDKTPRRGRVLWNGPEEVATMLTLRQGS